MAETIRCVAGDSLPLIRLSLFDAANKNARVDIAAAGGGSVKVRAIGSTDVLATLAATILDNQLVFSPPAGLPAGTYEGEVALDFGGLTQTLFEPLRFQIRAHF